MGRRMTVIPAVLAALGGLALAAAPAQLPTEAMVRQAIATFCERPLSTEGRAAVKTFLGFAVESDKVQVTLRQEYTPWMVEGKNYKNDELFLAAFTAGNILSQLDSGVCGNDPYSGEIQVFRVYRYLKTKDPSYAVPEIDNLLAMHRKGELALYLAKAEKEANAAEGKAGKKR